MRQAGRKSGGRRRGHILDTMTRRDKRRGMIIERRAELDSHAGMQARVEEENHGAVDRCKWVNG